MWSKAMEKSPSSGKYDESGNGKSAGSGSECSLGVKKRKGARVSSGQESRQKDNRTLFDAAISSNLSIEFIEGWGEAQLK